MVVEFGVDVAMSCRFGFDFTVARPNLVTNRKRRRSITALRGNHIRWTHTRGGYRPVVHCSSGGASDEGLLQGLVQGERRQG